MSDMTVGPLGVQGSGAIQPSTEIEYFASGLVAEKPQIRNETVSFTLPATTILRADVQSALLIAKASLQKECVAFLHPTGTLQGEHTVKLL